MKINYGNLLMFAGFFGLLSSCRKDELPVNYSPTPYQLETPSYFPALPDFGKNPLTVEGIELGRRLFYDERLSGDNTMSCATCHMPSKAFSDITAGSIGIDGLTGNRNTMAIFNLAWSPSLFWDGRSPSLEHQVAQPVENPIEMHEKWTNVIEKLYMDEYYPEMFARAFGTHGIDSVRATMAMAQFVRTIISKDSRYDQWRRGEIVLTADEFAGLNLMATEDGDCFHCHNPSNPLFTDYSLRNNGLQDPVTDIGKEQVTGSIADRGKMKIPSLRNLVFTAPYMHDGRFATLDDVIEFYSSGVHNTPYTDPLMKFAPQGGVQLNNIEKAQIKAFLLALTDSVFIYNPAYQDPGY